MGADEKPLDALIREAQAACLACKGTGGVPPDSHAQAACDRCRIRAEFMRTAVRWAAEQQQKELEAQEEEIKTLNECEAMMLRRVKEQEDRIEEQQAEIERLQTNAEIDSQMVTQAEWQAAQERIQALEEAGQSMLDAVNAWGVDPMRCHEAATRLRALLATKDEVTDGTEDQDQKHGAGTAGSVS